MEMQFSITEAKVSPGGFSLNISVRVATEMGLQPPVLEMKGRTVTDSEMENVPCNKDDSEQLFEKLTGLRRQIASENGLPPYIIFHDSTLTEMCRRLPKDMQEMKAVQGVGEAKLTKYGQRFLDAIREYTLPGQQ